tara:strand:+ start:914 stop:1753 length:840 start_codon:yes stop_codon:yes gene_type:complete
MEFSNKKDVNLITNMKKHLIIGNPVEHSLSPRIHNYWFKKYNIEGVYEKIVPKKNDLENIIKRIKENEIFGMNVTVPYKQDVLPFLETYSEIVKKTNSVNTIFKKDGKVYGDNTDVYGFEKSIINNSLIIKDKTILLFGAGGVVPSIICALKNMNVGKVYLSNRTLENAEMIKKKFDFIEILEWGEIKNCDVLINSTSVGLKKGDKINFDLKSLVGKKIFYDLIYNPPKTTFLSDAEKLGHRIINGRDMFLFQAQKAFNLWHNVIPNIDEKLKGYIYND